MPCSEIKTLLKQSIGLHAGSVGDSSIERAIRQRMNAIGIADESAYLSCLNAGADELAELIEEVVVPETWFFRNTVPFKALANFVPALLAHSQDRFLHILSLPCSTGEEAYSIAMTLLDCEASGSFDFVVDSIDVSKRAINKAKRAVYGSYSFREGDDIESMKEKYFLKEKNGFHLKPEVKRYVKPVQGNVLADNIAPSGAYYDVIFCRNLLIYFDRETQARVLNKLDALLKPTGILFLGHAETTQTINDHFVRLEIPKAFAYQKKATTPLASSKQRSALNVQALEAAYQQLLKATPVSASKASKGTTTAATNKTPKVKKSATQSREMEKADIHALISHHIELGRLTEASTQCEKLLKENPESAEGYYLLGLISHLEGNDVTAESLLKKAMYLDPNHHGALGLSAMLAEVRGDSDVANTLRRREQRVLTRKTSRKKNG